MTNDDLQRFLTIFASRDSGGTGDSNSNVTLVSQDDDAEDDDDDPDYVDEEEEEEDGDNGYYFYGYGYPASRRNWDRSDWWPVITEPQKEGLELLFGGEFGRILHQLKTRDGNKNVARSILSRGTSSRPTYREDLTSVRLLCYCLYRTQCSSLHQEILPNSSGTAVASYAANAYVGQFSSGAALQSYTMSTFAHDVW